MKSIRLAADTALLLLAVPLWRLLLLPMLALFDLVCMAARVSARPFDMTRWAASVFPVQFRDEWRERGRLP